MSVCVPCTKKKNTHTHTHTHTHTNRYFPEDCPSPICVPGPDSPCTHTVCFPQPTPAIYGIEVFSMIVFTVEYLVRVACVHGVPYR